MTVITAYVQCTRSTGDVLGNCSMNVWGNVRMLSKAAT